MEDFTKININNLYDTYRFAEKLLLLNRCYSLCSLGLDTNEYGNLTSKGKKELLEYFNNKEFTINYFVKNLHPNRDKDFHLDEIQSTALTNLLLKCYSLHEINGSKFAHSLSNHYEKHYHSFSTEDDFYDDNEYDVREANREFEDMMDDFDAWGNID